MKTMVRSPLLLVLALLLIAGCSSLPGLRVLTGQDSSSANADTVVENTELVMADKSGSTDPALMAAADRIEQANNSNVDIIEIRQDLSKDVFNVYMLYQIPSTVTTNADYVNFLRRTVELTWQGTLKVSQGSSVLRINMLQPFQVSTLNNGLSFVGQISSTFEISRADAMNYLAHTHTVQDFVALIAQGKLTYDAPQQGQEKLYEGTPNHSMFMLASLEAQTKAEQAQQSQSSSTSGQ
jgi:hypothetical protein